MHVVGPGTIYLGFELLLGQLRLFLWIARVE